MKQSNPLISLLRFLLRTLSVAELTSTESLVGRAFFGNRLSSKSLTILTSDTNPRICSQGPEKKCFVGLMHRVRVYNPLKCLINKFK